MPRSRRAAIAAILAVAVLAVAVIGVNAIGGAAQNRVTTAGADPTATPAATSEAQTLCESFLGNLAGQLGVTVDKLQSGFLAAAGATIDKAVADGVLTQDQGAFLKGRLSAAGNGPLCQGFPIGRIGMGMGKGEMRLRIDASPILDATAAALKISRQQLLTELGALQRGENLKTLASRHGVDYATVTAAIHAAVKAELDPQVTAGSISQQQEDAFLSALDTRLADGGLPFGLGFGAPGFRGPSVGGFGPFPFGGGLPFGPGFGHGRERGGPNQSPAPSPATSGSNG